MKTIGVLALVLAAALSVAREGAPPPAAAADAPSGIDSRIRLDWEVGTTRGGRPVIQGHVHNAHGRPAADVRLLVETLAPPDSSTARSSSTTGPTSRCRSGRPATPTGSR
jgi:hypothetical protein